MLSLSSYPGLFTRILGYHGLHRRKNLAEVSPLALEEIVSWLKIA
jgi:hypothetical protein